MKKLALIIFILLGGLTCFITADLVCTGDTTPNLKTNFNINCSTMPSQSKCYVVVSDNSTPSIILGEYPKTCFGEDKICYNTADDGRFVATIYLDDGIYSTNTNYTANINCIAQDNSTNSTDIYFVPSGYAPLNWLAHWIDFAIANMLWIVGGAIILIIGVCLLYLIFFSR
jgi:hypothetical protein